MSDHKSIQTTTDLKAKLVGLVIPKGTTGRIISYLPDDTPLVHFPGVSPVFKVRPNQITEANDEPN